MTGGGGASGTLAVDGIGSLCDSPFGLATDDVACRQMGYERSTCCEERVVVSGLCLSHLLVLN